MGLKKGKNIYRHFLGLAGYSLNVAMKNNICWVGAWSPF